MADEVIAPQGGMNPELEVVEETVVEETTETPAEEEVEETVPKSQFDQVLARAKKAEAEIKKNKPAQTPNINKPSSLSEEDVEAKILISQGLKPELLNDLKVIAKARGKGLIEAKSDPIFVAILKNAEDEEKARKAKLPASRGSGTAKKEKDINSPGLTDAEHKALWMEKR